MKTTETDPSAIVEWGLPAVIAWVAWRDLERVRHHLDACREADTALPRPATVAGLQLWGILKDGGYGSNAPTEIENARLAVWAAAQCGAIIFTAENLETGTVEPIPAAAWRFLRPDTNGGAADLLVHQPAMEYGRIFQRVSWRAPAARRMDLLTLWPPIPVVDALASAIPQVAKPEPKKRGAKPVHDWEAGKRYAFALIDEKGTPNPIFESAWKQADLERAVAAHMEKGSGQRPGESNVRNHVSIWLREYQENYSIGSSIETAQRPAIKA